MLSEKNRYNIITKYKRTKSHNILNVDTLLAQSAFYFNTDSEIPFQWIYMQNAHCVNISRS